MQCDIVCAETETACKTGMVLLCGGITSQANVDYQLVVRETIGDIRYNNSDKGESLIIVGTGNISHL